MNGHRTGGTEARFELTAQRRSPGVLCQADTHNRRLLRPPTNRFHKLALPARLRTILRLLDACQSRWQALANTPAQC